MANYVLLCQCTGPIIAQRLQAELEAEDIPVRIEGAQADAIFGGLASVTGIRVLVPEDRLDDAERIVDTMDDDAEPSPPADEPAPIQDVSLASFAARRQLDENDDDDDDDDGEQQSRKLSERRADLRKWLWPPFALLAAFRLLRGDMAGAAVLVVVTLLAWGATRIGEEAQADKNKNEKKP